MLWHPKGTTVRRIIRNYLGIGTFEKWIRACIHTTYRRRELWSISGHMDYYGQNMYLFEKEGGPYVVKPMNCPFHIQIYKAKPRSYKELPIRYAEWGTVYRYERSGTLHGLMRVRGFTQDDAHIFCTPEQVDEEILKLIDFAKHMLRKFGFNKYQVYLSTKNSREPERYMGSEESWEKAQKALAEALKKIDINIFDASGREWQCTTIQFDFNLPKRFNITYNGADGKEHEVIMIQSPLRVYRTLLRHTNRTLRGEFSDMTCSHTSENTPHKQQTNIICPNHPTEASTSRDKGQKLMILRPPLTTGLERRKFRKFRI